MRLIDVAVRLGTVVFLAAWGTVILSIAVFAIPQHQTGGDAIFYSLLVTGGGFAVAWMVVRVLNPLRSQLPTPEQSDQRWPAGAATPGLAPAAPSLAAPNPPAPRTTVLTLEEPLSEREIEVLSLVATGKANKEIAEALVISLATVKTHTNNIYRKLGARNRAEALARAHDLGLDLG
ncbi:MAG: response regulator transcription factor [Dehalococcoidia bacterium]